MTGTRDALTLMRQASVLTAADFAAPVVDRAALAACGPELADADVDALEALSVEVLGVEDPVRHHSRRWCLEEIARWLSRFPGTTWQQRWLASGIQDAARAFSEASNARRYRLVKGVAVLICCGVLHPDADWLVRHKFVDLYPLYQSCREPERFVLLAKLLRDQGADDRIVGMAMRHLVMMLVSAAKTIDEIAAEDLIAHHWRLKARFNKMPITPLEALWRVMHDQHMIEGPARLRAAVQFRQLTVEELVDRHGLVHRPMRDLLVEYFRHRAPGTDYSTLSNQVYWLGELFWGDLERHQPGITSLSLPPQVADAWKRRIATRPDGTVRQERYALLNAVRAFYADINHWAYEDPARWAVWAAPCPVTKGDLAARRKHQGEVKARMHARTRTLAPALPHLTAVARARRDHARTLLATARTTEPGTAFAVDGRSYLRVACKTKQARQVLVQATPAGDARPFDAVAEERESFWAWAAIEVLRLSGLRIEEMMELTHLSIRRYTQPGGEIVPLLQIAPSKIDAERVFPITPELAHVLAQVVTRVRGANGVIPSCSRYDIHERVYGPPLPHLFQRTVGSGHQVFSPETVRNWISRTLERSPVYDTDGTLISFTPHDFRRLFATDVVNTGLPIHIAAAILGHTSLDTTRSYAAIYPEETLRTYQAYIHSRRQDRPGEEYREPTSEEWADFERHFTLRKVAYGNCDRPYGSPCAHEHACVRCPMLRAEPSRLPLMRELEENLDARITEARGRQWLGEVAGLEQTLIALRAKTAHVERLLGEGVSDAPAPMS
ncbi:site-specific integrase [Streptacidiphilus jiangxiensis]|uniref:Phage integrase family protein n=1 Tax=Streptacidiphilus jiangxiensis TaxID=235985 RepID=A0A1H8A6Z5_STRJI|nr:site-specific integrase [Streptacidiphilus jiangxiensis]SEM65569.1 Phage integrase family protein [Streptacidiphilus jiangxiensis]